MGHCAKCGSENKWNIPEEPSLYPCLAICNACGEFSAKWSPSSGWVFPTAAELANMQVLHGEGWFFPVHRDPDVVGFLAHTEKGKLIARNNLFKSELLTQPENR